MTADVETVDAILKALYDGISFEAGQRPNWDRVRPLFADGTRLIPPARRDTLRMLTFEQYAEGMTRAIDRGVLKSFIEREVSRKQEEFGNMVHAWSTYESRHTAQDREPFSRGINSIQLERHAGRWWIVNILWEAERPDMRIPDRNLTPR